MTQVVGHAPGSVVAVAVAVALGAGFVELTSLPAGLSDDDRVLMVDDVVGPRSQAATARAAVQQSGAEWLGMSVIVDQRAPDARAGLGRVTALLHADDLSPAS